MVLFCRGSSVRVQFLDAWAAHNRKTIEATRGVPVEFNVRDVYTVHGSLGNARHAVEIARREIDRYYKP